MELETKMEQEYKRMEDNYLSVIKEIRGQLQTKNDQYKDEFHKNMSNKMNELYNQWNNNKEIYQKKYDDINKEYRTLKMQFDSIVLLLLLILFRKENQMLQKKIIKYLKNKNII